MPDDPALTLPQVGEQLGIHRDSVHRLIASGQLQAIVISTVGSARKHRRVMQSEVDDFKSRATDQRLQARLRRRGQKRPLSGRGVEYF
jgi:excisionase family DNA binding protein